MSTARRPLARAGFGLALLFLASRLTGWVRVAIIGAVFGAGAELDAYFAAFRIPDAVFQLAAAGALSSALVPVLSGLFATGQAARAWRVAASVATLVVGVVGSLALLAAVAAPALLPVVAPGFPADGQALAVGLTRILLLSTVLLTLGTLATAVLNSQERFIASGLAPVAYNGAIIVGTLLLAGPLGVVGVALAVVAGAAAHLAVQLPQLVGRASRWVGLDVRDPAVGETIGLLVPRALGLGASQIVFLVNTSLASVLGPGAVSVYSVAFTILQIPVGLIGLPLGIVLLPSLAAARARGADARYHELLERSLRLLLFVMLPLSLAMAVLAEPLVRLLVGYGRFDPGAVERTAMTLQAFLVALTPEALVAVLARAFYARHDTRRPVAAALAAVALDVPAAILLAGLLGTPGLALAIGLGAWLEAGLLAIWLARVVPGFRLERIVRAGVGHAVGAVLVGAIVLAADRLVATLLGEGLGGPVSWLGRGFVATAAGAAGYLAYARLRRWSELAELRPLLPGRLAARWPTGNGSQP